MTKKKEPSNQDILESMNKRFNMVFTELKRNDTRFDLIHRQLQTLKDISEEIKENQSADSEVLDEVRDTLVSLSKAVDLDAVTIVNYGNRITRLEKALK